MLFAPHCFGQQRMRGGRNQPDAPWSGDFTILKSLIPYLLEFPSRVVAAMAFLVFAKLANVVVPIVLKHLVDALTLGDSSARVIEPLSVPISLLLAYGVLRFSTSFFGEVRDVIFSRVAERGMRRISLRVFEHLHQLDLSFHLSRKTGGLARDIERGTSGIAFLLRFMLFNILPTLLELVLIAVILVSQYHIGYLLITLAAVVSYGLFSVWVTEWRLRFVRDANQKDNQSNTRAIDSLLNFETVKYFGNETHETQLYDQQLADWETARLKNRYSLFALNSGQALIIGISMTAMMFMAADDVVSGDMTIGDLVLINAYMIQLFVPLNFLGFVYREIKNSLANIERLFQLLDEPAKITDAPNAPDLVVNGGGIQFDAVNFSYEPTRQILKNVSFCVPPGKKVAIVGPSGSGKSTIARLLFRFYEPDSGHILVDNQNVSEVSQHSLRNAIGVVPQDTVLFNASIGYNIAYGKYGSSDEAVAAVAERAHLMPFIQRLPEGFDTLVGERGLKLSGGEKQRIAIARTLLKAPAIMVFDEATSSLDSGSEKAILGALREAEAHHTSLAIAHRLSTVMDADQILVLDQGEIVERGTHAELLAREGAYFRLWMHQQEQHD